HIDQQLVYGKELPLERLLQQLRKKEDCPIEDLKYTSLRCFAARSIVDNDVNYKGSIPIPLHGYIEKHRLDESDVPQYNGLHLKDVYDCEWRIIRGGLAKVKWS